jgi:hypothetical protein
MQMQTMRHGTMIMSTQLGERERNAFEIGRSFIGEDSGVPGCYAMSDGT